MIQRDKQGRFLKGHEVPEDIRKKLSLTLINIPLTKEHKDKISKNHRHYQSEETKIIISNLLKGKPKSEKHKENMSLANRGKHHSPNTEFKKGCLSPMSRKKHKLESIEKMRVSHKKTYEDGLLIWNKNKKNCFSIETINKMRIDKEQKWAEKDYRERQINSILKGLMKRPTSYEKRISDLCIENNLPFIYCGNGTFLIGHKNPDFIDKKDRIAIEVYHTYFKERDFGSCEDYEEKRSNYFAKYGYKTIFIRTEEIEAKNWKEICLNKIGGLKK